MRFALILSVLIAIVAVLFALQNTGDTELMVAQYRVTGPTALILMVTFGVGLLVGILATTPRMIKQRREIRQLEKRIVTPQGTTTTARTTRTSDAYRDPDPTL